MTKANYGIRTQNIGGVLIGKGVISEVASGGDGNIILLHNGYRSTYIGRISSLSMNFTTYKLHFNRTCKNTKQHRGRGLVQGSFYNV